MNQLISQLPLGVRIPALRDSILSTRAMKEQCVTEEAALMDQLAQAEAEVVGHAYGWEGVELSGLIPEGENPHITAPPAAPPASSRAAHPAPEEATAEPSFLTAAGEAAPTTTTPRR